MVYKLLLLTVLFCSCKLRSANNASQQESQLIGKWKMTQYYADIGDGKENWVEADKERTIEFKENGAFIDSEQANAGRYVLQDSIHIEIIPHDKTKTYKMQIIELNAKNLVLRANCIEGCGEKYVRVN
jgi:hypothetical protein